MRPLIEASDYRRGVRYGRPAATEMSRAVAALCHVCLRALCILGGRVGRLAGDAGHKARVKTMNGGGGGGVELLLYSGGRYNSVRVDILRCAYLYYNEVCWVASSVIT